MLRMKQHFRNRTKEKKLCSSAVSEILDYELVNEREILEIVHRFRWLYKVIPYTPVDGPLGEFHKLYDKLLQLTKYLDIKQNAINALNEYAAIKDRKEEFIIEWLLKYESLGRFLTKFYIDGYFTDQDAIDKGFQKLKVEFTLLVGINDFMPILDFNETFGSHYHKVVNKFNDYQEDIPYYEREYYTIADINAPLTEFIQPIENVKVNDIFNPKMPFEIKRLKHLVPIKASISKSPSLLLQNAHDLFHIDSYEEAIVLYNELLQSRNDLTEAKVGLAVSYFILEEYELAESFTSQLNKHEYKELISLITHFKNEVENGSLKDYNSFEIADKFCEEAIDEDMRTIDRDLWIKEFENLFSSISIQADGLPSISNSNFNGRKYTNIELFHSLYVKRSFEKTILNEMTHEEAVKYFISNMDIHGLDKILDYREYYDIEKYDFLTVMSSAFYIFKERGNTKLTITNGVCKGCQHGHKGYSFIGNNDDSYMELLILLENERVSDIFECNMFKYNTYNKEYLKNRITLKNDDDSEMPF